MRTDIVTKEQVEHLKRIATLTSISSILVYWMQERESIRLKKEAGQPKPWTEDPILQNYRFCNVVRMDDKVSRWLLNNWYLPNKDDANMLIAVVVARHLNLPSTLEVIGFPTEDKPIHVWFESVKRKVRNIQASGRTAYNGAYMVRGIETADKIEMIIDWVAKPLHEDPPKLNQQSMEECVNALIPYWGLSLFMAGQVVADLRWVWNYGNCWLDKMVYAPMGPGSKRGMNRLHGRKVDQALDPKQFQLELCEVIKELREVQTLRHVTRRMEAMDYQNCLCEFDKYSRTVFNEGKPKQKYAGV